MGPAAAVVTATVYVPGILTVARISAIATVPTAIDFLLLLLFLAVLASLLLL
jgi:hypothetical protein